MAKVVGEGVLERLSVCPDCLVAGSEGVTASGWEVFAFREEPSFSKCPCDSCGDELAGDRYKVLAKASLKTGGEA